MEIDDAFRGLEADVGGGVGREDGFLGGHHALDDGAADADRVDEFRFAVSQGPGDQLPGGVAEDDHAAVGLGEDPQQAVEDLRQHVVEGHGAGQRAADFREGLEFGLGVDFRPPTRRARGHVQPRHDRGVVAAGLVVNHQGGGLEIVAVVGGGLVAGGVGIKDHDHVAEGDAVVVVQQAALADLLAVDVGPVPALEVFDIELVVDAVDLRMLAADRSRVEHNMAIGVAAEDGRLSLQEENSARVRAFDRA